MNCTLFKFYKTLQEAPEQPLHFRSHEEKIQQHIQHVQLEEEERELAGEILEIL